MSAEDGRVVIAVQTPPEATGQPAEELQSGETVAGSVDNFDPIDEVKALERGGQVENLGHGIAQIKKSCPVEVGESGTGAAEGLDFAEDTELGGGVGPRIAVHDKAVDPAP